VHCSFIKDANACISACLIHISLIKAVLNLAHSSPLIEAEDSGIWNACVKKKKSGTDFGTEH